MSLIKANQLYREKKYKDALEMYIKLRNENPNVSIYNKNIESIYKVGYRPLKYSIVSAVYGVEPYLNEFIYSVINQTLEFKENIELILVDDGSLDGSAEIIKRWKKEYPYNIKYIYKENGGQASARNAGMEYVTTDWVTFIDPDDFISKNYFKEIDNYLCGKEETTLISCNFIFYYENKGGVSDTHPLRYRFSKNIKIAKINNLSYKDIQLSVNSALFKTKIIRKNALQMNPDITPNFEDAEFVGRYLILSQGNLVFLKKAHYFYRKRQDATSTLDTTWLKKEQFGKKLEQGSLALLEFSEKHT
ncbi:MAG: glycosyltransferase family 2 protein, partial [Methylococcales bacterium]|nr:glycosyltransferase family 2 protein [Methylococcales bacterium]